MVAKISEALPVGFSNSGKSDGYNRMRVSWGGLLNIRNDAL